ncbi:RNA polymerase, sigma subunit, ECF family [Litoreibacter janthinus]|uniref:RNA polymerase, sigma subunit, ECF family n=2 Tax=Litoreibacter janthinus TaxID=670154 RepID=A0A1I6HSU7_9RHOB|nr:RNA polymerase, sigma subunit, ECF family [Litoreibacter janthinus]
MALDQSDQLDDDALLVLFANGDGAAAEALTVRLSPQALSFARRMLGDLAEAEDVVQEAMLRLWRIAPDWRPGEAKPATWLYRVVNNLCIDRLRRRQRVDVGLDGTAEPADPTPSVEARLIQADRLAALDAALEILPDRQRQAVVLRHIEGLQNPEIAQIMEISVEAVESLTARGKRALANVLASRKEELSS